MHFGHRIANLGKTDMFDGPILVLLLFAMVYSWLLFNAAAYLASKFKRFSLRTLLIATTIASLAMGIVAKLW